MEAILLEAMLLRLVMVSGRAVEWMIMMASRYLKQVRRGNGRTGLGCKLEFSLRFIYLEMPEISKRRYHLI